MIRKGLNKAVAAFLAACSVWLPLPALAGEVTEHAFHSETLARDYAYVAYVPDGYSEGSSHYPVVYLLHGSLGNERNWTEFVEAERILDEMIEAGEIPPTIVIMPGSLSWWADGHNEPAETAFIDDLIPHVDMTWRTLPNAESRVIGGLSAGGFGTVNLAMKHPDLFAAALAFSPASYAGLPPEGSTAWTHPTFQDDAGNFDPDLWTKLNYESLIEAYMEQDKVVPFYINSGDHDGLDIAYHGAVLYQRLREHQADLVEFRVIDGGHEWPVWIATLPEALSFAFEHVAYDIPPFEDGNPFARFIGTWTLKDDLFQQVWDGQTVEALTLPDHITRCDELNTNHSILCVVDAGDLKGQIYWTRGEGSETVNHLSQFGTTRIGTGTGEVLANQTLQLKISFSDEPEGTYRIYEYAWVSDDEYELMSRQYSADGTATGNWYGGRFVRHAAGQ
ncbi:MAG: alpha/beta hydrolase-fold protein [Pseudomonadota bacterium]